VGKILEEIGEMARNFFSKAALFGFGACAPK
jgi:hypothetical protein